MFFVTQNKQLKNRKIVALAQMLRRLIHQGENIKEQLASIRYNNNKNNSLNHIDLFNLTCFVKISDNPKTNGSHSRHAKDVLIQSFLCDAATVDVIQKSRVPAVSRVSTLQTTKRSHKIEESAVAPPDDELFLLIGDEDCGESGVHVEYRQYYLNQKLNLAIEAAKIGKIASIESTPKCRSSRRKLQFDALRQNNLNDRLIKYLCHNRDIAWNQRPISGHIGDRFCGIRREIDIRMAELHEMMAYEEMLMQQLSQQCEKYHRLNNKYMSKMHFEVRIDEVQRCLDVCAKEIIRCELELQRIKDEIHARCGILYNLQRMENAEPTNAIDKSINSSDEEHIRFSDSINNKSLII